MKKFSIVAGFRESAKSTLLGKIDPIYKIVFEDRWFIPFVARTEDKAESKVVPLKIEFENNRRLISDFGELQGSVEWEFGAFITKTGRKVKGYGRDQVLTGEENSGHRPDHIIFDDVSANNAPDSPMLVQKYVDIIKGDDRQEYRAFQQGYLPCAHTKRALSLRSTTRLVEERVG